jgi:alkyl hydroperoxide reductase subunit F
MHDVIVIGAGPAGLAAATYTLRHHLCTLLIAPDLGGKAVSRLRLPWLDQPEAIVGEETVEQMRRQVLEAAEPVRYFDMVENIYLRGDVFHVHTVEGGAFPTKAVVVASGVSPRQLGVPGERRLDGRGLTYSATSHAPLFAGRRVIVIGDNLRALRAVAELRSTAAHVTLLVPGQDDLASFALGRRLLDDPRVQIRIGHSVTEILGDHYVCGVRVVGPHGETEVIAAEAVCVELGLVAQTSFLGPLIEHVASGQVVADERCATRCPGLFVAGDISSNAYPEHLLIALGEGTKAGISAAAYVLEGWRNAP